MDVIKVPLLDTGSFTGLTKLYLSEDPKLKPFYNTYFNLENFDVAVEERKKFETNRTVLAEELYEQHKNYFSTFPQLKHTIELIKEKNTFTITTGHQICLATGPLYFIYKIASAINLCQKLKAKYPLCNFVPVYWMATEDHDFEEINHIHLFGKKISWDLSSGGATGRISTAEINPFIEEIRTALGDKINLGDGIENILKAYETSPDLSEATRSVVLNLFGDKGLLVLDADSKKLKHVFKEIIQQDIFQKISFSMVSKTMQQLIDQNLIKEEKIQVKPREINFFYLIDNLRKRIVLEGTTYKVIDTSIEFSEAELRDEIDQFPERFSPNVIMRPVYQESILPNLTYIGGAGELAYWFELKAVFDAHAVYFPMLALRNSFLWIDKKQADKLNQLGIEIKELFNTTENLIAKLLQYSGLEEVSFTHEKETINAILDQLKLKILSIDPTLTASADAERQKLLKSIEMLEQKTIKAQKLKFETHINQLKKIKENLFPDGALQERHENIMWLYIKFGNDVINKLVTLAEVDAKDFTLITA